MGVVFNEKQRSFCISCKSCKLADDVADWKCLHPKNISVDLLTGVVLAHFFHPDFLRSKDSGGCEIEGKWFEKRPAFPRRGC